MANAVISVESTCDLTQEILNEYGIKLINMEYSVDGDTHLMGDGTYTMHEFYQKMREGAVTKTAQVNSYAAREFLRETLSQGRDVIHLAFSSSLSGTYNSFASAAEELKEEFPERKIAVIDSLSACAGQGLFTVLVAEWAREHSFEETVEYAEEIKHRVVHLFVVDDLKYLARGGRISTATALLGNAIHMKPVMHMDKDGHLVAFKKVLSRKKSILAVAELVAERFDKSFGRIFIAHADCLEDAEMLSSHIRKTTGITPELMDLGMVIGSHSGPGTLSVFFTGKGR